MMKKFLGCICLVVLAVSVYAQTLSPSAKKDILNNYLKHIKTCAAISSENFDMLPVYEFQLSSAEAFLTKNEIYNSDNDIYAKWIELKTLVKQNRELVEFMLPRMSDWYYRKAVFSKSNNKPKEAYDYLQKSIQSNPRNVMANYELAKISLDSGAVIKTADRLTEIINGFAPSEEESLLCKNLLVYTYDKNLLQSLSLIKQGKYAYAIDILEELEDYCKKDPMKICNEGVVKNKLADCRNNIYKEHIDVTKKAIAKGRNDVAGDFINNTYDYFQRNRESISDTAGFDEVVNIVVNSYIAQAKAMPEAKNNEIKMDLLHKARELAAMVGGNFEDNILKQIALLQGSLQESDPVLDSLESAAPNTGYAEQYPEFIKQTESDAEEDVKKIEKEYIPSSDNALPEKSTAVTNTKTRSLRKEIDDKFFETLSYLKVNNYEKALEVLESANKLAKIDAEKDEVEKMYISAIREVTARRMHNAEYAIFQGEVEKADSLVAKTEELLERYKMKDDSVIVKIMNSYLRAIDNKVCSKKQEEINVMVYNIIDCIRKNDFYLAEDYINRAMQIKGSSECRLDKSRLRALKRQIEQPLEYVKRREATDSILARGDTNRYLREYAELEQFYITHSLKEMSVQHRPIREILYSFGNDALAVNTIEQLMKYRQYEQSVEALASLKDFGYKSKHTKKIQKKIGAMMSLEQSKRNEKIAQSNRLMDKYESDKWFKYLIKSYKKNLIKWNKQNP